MKLEGDPRTAVCVVRSEPWGRARLYSVQTTFDIQRVNAAPPVRTADVEHALEVVAGFLRASGTTPTTTPTATEREARAGPRWAQSTGDDSVTMPP